MEIYRGSRTKEQLKLAEKFIKKFNIISLNQVISQNALIVLKKYQFTCFIDIPDALIASTAIDKKAQLLTINLKDFDLIKGLIVKKPY
jgi:predicted nucleic acid-binding protein